MQLPKVELKQANIPMWILQNTFASTETQRHVKPLRMIDEVCFEMADIKQTRLAEHEGLKLMRFLRFALRKTRAFLSRKITLQSK